MKKLADDPSFRIELGARAADSMAAFNNERKKATSSENSKQFGATAPSCPAHAISQRRDSLPRLKKASQNIPSHCCHAGRDWYVALRGR